MPRTLTVRPHQADYAVPLSDGADDGNPEASENYLGRLLKYIPAEMVGAYVALRGIVPKDDASTVLWIVALITWLLVPVYLVLAARQENKKPVVLQIWLASVAFPVWVFAVGGPPIDSLPWYPRHEYLGSIALILVTVLLGVVAPKPGTGPSA